MDLFSYEGFDELDKRAVERAYKLADLIMPIGVRRLALNMSIADLSNKSGVSKGLIKKIENLDTIPRLDILLALYQALGIGINICEVKDE